MLSILANHNPDIDKLIKKGYALSVDSNYLVIRDIPYLDDKKSLQIGAIVSKLVFTDQHRVTLEDHQIFFLWVTSSRAAWKKDTKPRRGKLLFTISF